MKTPLSHEHYARDMRAFSLFWKSRETGTGRRRTKGVLSVLSLTRQLKEVSHDLGRIFTTTTAYRKWGLPNSAPKRFTRRGKKNDTFLHRTESRLCVGRYWSGTKRARPDWYKVRRPVRWKPAFGANGSLCKNARHQRAARSAGSFPHERGKNPRAGIQQASRGRASTCAALRLSLYI